MKRYSYRQHAISLLLAVVGIFVASSLPAYGKDIDAERAVRIAKRYVKLPNRHETKSHKAGATPTEKTPYYIFNDANGHGFVVVAADDAMGEVLAYGTELPLDTINANPAIRFLLDGYRQTFEALKEGGIDINSSKRTGLFTKIVKPLLKSKWGQEHPFNAKTGYPYSGCVATAVAQMMYYYQWPAQGHGKNEYKVTYYNTMASADFSESHYDWANMLTDYRYPTNATTEQENAVALLMRDVGIASFMQYTPSASGTQGVLAYKALQNNFDYTAAYVTKAMEGTSGFAEILRQELLNGCPVYLEGRPAGLASGHAWVTDGFDENGLFHMNFGWEGQGDAYYSLTNMNVSQTGSEFQGKPLAFNRAITAILAHPNNGKYPDIDRALLESSPQLMFNEGGALTLKEATGKSFDPKQELTIEMSSFVNRGNPFKGDIGIAVYDEDGNMRRVTYSDDHASGGLTQRIYGADHDGYMGTDYLINEAQGIKTSVKGLANGYYTLVPVCIARNDDGTWGEIFRMRRAPVIEVEQTDGSGRIAEMCTTDAHFQLMSQPRLADKAEQGAKVHAFFTVKNLNGVPRDCYMRVQLRDENKTVVLSTRTEGATDIEGFTEAEIPIVLSLPSNLAPGRYEVMLQMFADEAETQPYPINNIHDKDAAYIEVLKAQDKPLMAKAEVFLADDSNERVQAGTIDMSKIPNFKLGVALRTSEGRSYEGLVTMLSEDILTMEQTQVPGINDEVSISSSFDIPLFSYWLRKSSLKWIDGHTYRIIVMGQIDGNDVELKNPQLPSYYLKRSGDILTIHQDIPTNIAGSAANNPFSIIYRGQQLLIWAEDIKHISLYDVGGRLIKQTTANDNSHATLSLQGVSKGIYLLRIEAGEPHHFYRFML